MNRTANLAGLIAKANVNKNVYRDKYGRTVTEYSLRKYDEATKSDTNPYGFVASYVAVVVNLPKVAVEAGLEKYLVNDWSAGIHEGITRHNDRLDAHITAVSTVIRHYNQ